MSTQSRTSPDEKLSVSQVADEIGCHPNTVWNHIKSGQLTAVRFGPRLVRVNRSDLEQFISAYQCADEPNWLSLSRGVSS
jgi:excisionase family DNA binding protein